MYFRYFVIISLWKRDWTFIGTNLYPHPKDALFPSLVEIGPVVLEKIFKFRQCIFSFFIISPWKRALPFIWITNLNPLNLRMLCAKFGWNWSSGSWEVVLVIWLFGRKVYDNDDDNNNEDDGQHTSFDQKSRTELSAPKTPDKQTSFCPLLLTLLLSMFYQFKPFNFDASPYLHVFLVFPSFDVLLGSNLPNLCSIHFTSFIWSIILWVFDWSNSKDFIGCFFLGVAIFSLPASHQPYLATTYHGGQENILGKSSRGSCAIG